MTVNAVKLTVIRLVEEINFLIFPFFRPGVEVKRSIEFGGYPAWIRLEAKKNRDVCACGIENCTNVTFEHVN